MKKKKFLKKYGNLTVQLFNVSLSGGLNFEGTTYDDQHISVNFSGELSNTMPVIYTETDYTIAYLVENLSEFDIEISMDTVKPPYMITCFIASKEQVKKVVDT